MAVTSASTEKRNTMSGKKLTDDELDLHRVAHAFECGSVGDFATHDQIAKQTGIPRARVSELMKAAMRRNLLTVNYHSPSDDILMQVQKSHRTEEQQQLLLADLQRIHERSKDAASGGQIRSVTIVDDGWPSGSEMAFDNAVQRFGKCCVPTTADVLINQAKAARDGVANIGISWGRTVSAVLKSWIVAAGSSASLRVKPKLNCIPLWGEIIGPEVAPPPNNSEGFPDTTQLSSTILAQQLGDALEKCGMRKESPTLSLLGVPIVLPTRHGEDPERRRMALELFADTTAYGKIYGGSVNTVGTRMPLADELDMIVAGVGATTYAGRFLSPEVMKQLTPDKSKELMSSVYGDIAGVLMEKPTGAQKLPKVIVDLNNRWTCVNLSHLRKCARRGTSGNGQGVVVFAVDKTRARVVLEGIRKGIVTHLVTEGGMATELQRIVSMELTNHR